MSNAALDYIMMNRGLETESSDNLTNHTETVEEIINGGSVSVNIPTGGFPPIYINEDDDDSINAALGIADVIKQK